MGSSLCRPLPTPAERDLAFLTRFPGDLPEPWKLEKCCLREGDPVPWRMRLLGSCSLAVLIWTVDCVVSLFMMSWMLRSLKSEESDADTLTALSSPEIKPN